MRKHRIVLGIVVAAAAALLASCSAAQTKHPHRAAAGTIADRHQSIYVQSTVVGKGELKTNHVVSGTVVPVTKSNVAARVAGIVKSVNQEAGTWVKKNEVIVQLDDSQLKLSVESSHAALQTARVNLQKAKAQRSLANLTLKRDKSLIKKNLIPQSQVDVDSTKAESADQSYRAALAAVAQAKVHVKQAELNLRYASIRAPFAGQLAAINVNEGEFVSQNTPVFVLASRSREIDFDVPPGDSAALAKGTQISFVYQGRSLSAVVTESPSTPINGVVPIVAHFRSATASLPYGTVGSVRYPLDLARAIIVPISSIQTSGNQNYVYAIVGGKAVQRTVNVVAESGTNAAVDGIAAGTRLVVNPPPGLLAGSSVSLTQSGNTNG